MALKEGAEALEGGGPETCDARAECLAEECAERAPRGAECACGASGSALSFCVGSSMGKAFSFCCFGIGGSSANRCSQ